MGLLDLPAPLFNAADEAAASVLPPLARLVIWAAIGALASMELYRYLSPQQRIMEVRQAIQQSQRRLTAYDGDLAGARRLIGRLLSAALRRIALVTPAAIIASLPVILLVIWMDATYGLRFPEAAEGAEVHTEPSGYQAQLLIQGPADNARLVLADQEGLAVLALDLQQPARLLHKKRWWNLLVANPAGYLPQNAPIDVVWFDFPRMEILPTGPRSLRSWEAPFILALVMWALTLKYVRGIA